MAASKSPSMAPSMSPLPSMEPSFSTSPSIEPALQQPMESPSSSIIPWLVGVCTVEHPENNYLSDFIRGSNNIGHKGAMNNVSVRLFDYDCENEKDLMNSTNAVTIFNTTQPDSLPGDTGSFLYDINISQSNIWSDTGGFVTSTWSNESGEVKFCTRISTYEGSIEIAFRECNFKFRYNLISGFNLADIEISELNTDMFEIDLESDYKVTACQCEDFVCTSQGPIKQNEGLAVCLFPDHSGTPTNEVVISNFNLRLYAGTPRTPGYVAYNPVWFGANSWNSDALTSVSEKTTLETEVVMIQTQIIAQFYIQKHEEINVDGSAFLEFFSAKTAKDAVTSTFAMKLDLEFNIGEGCLKTMLKNIRAFF